MRRLQCLDGLRGVLAVYVMISHMMPFSTLPSWLVGPLSHGGAGVDAFFVLSGLVIVQSLQAHDWQRGRFLAARAVRIFPVFLVVFAFAAGVQARDIADHGRIYDLMPWIGPDAYARSIWTMGWPHHWLVSMAAHLTMTHGLFPDAVLPDAWVEYLGPAWSLSTEWQFYALAALAAPWLARGRLGGLQGFAAALLVLGAAGAAWDSAAPDGFTFSRAFLPNKAAYFALGVVSAVLLRATRRDRQAAAPGHSPLAAGTSRGVAAAWAWFAVVLAVTLLLSFMKGVEKLAVPLVWVAVLAAEAWPRQTRTGWLAWVLTRPGILWLGAISYPLYLVHTPLQKLVARLLGLAVHGDPAWFTALWLPAALLPPLGVAWLLHIGVEAPAMRRFRGAAAGSAWAVRERPAVTGVAPGAGDSLCAAPKWISPTRSPASRIPMSRSRTG